MRVYFIQEHFDSAKDTFNSLSHCENPQWTQGAAGRTKPEKQKQWKNEVYVINWHKMSYCNCNRLKMPHTTHRKKHISIQRFLSPSCCLNALNTLAAGTFASVFCIHRKAVHAPVSFIPFPHEKPQCIFGCHKVDSWWNIPLFYIFAFLKLGKNIPLHFVK